MQNNAAPWGGEGRERGGIISWIGRPCGIRALLLVFSGTGTQMGGRMRRHRNRTNSTAMAETDRLTHVMR